MTTQYDEARFDALLAECTERMRVGEDIDLLLAQSPVEYRDELAALLPVTGQLGMLGREPSSDFVAALESRLLEAVDVSRSAERVGWWARFSRAWQRSAMVKVAAAAPVALLLIAGSGVAAAEASKDSLPGSVLYPVRQARERAELLLARNTEARVNTYSSHVVERGEDLERAIHATTTTGTLDEIAAQTVRAAQAMVDEALRLHAQGNERAPLRALLAIRGMQDGLDRLQADASPRQRPVFVRLQSALREQEERLPVVRPRDAPPSNDRQQAIPPVERPLATFTPAPTRDAQSPPTRESTTVPTREATLAPTRPSR